jgi:hypothetical protein
LVASVVFEQSVADEAARAGAGRDGEHGAARVANVGGKRIVLGEPALDRDELSLWVAHQGEEQQAAVEL